MTDRIKIEWEEPGPASKCRLTVVGGPESTVEYRDPTESDLTRALELLSPEVKRRILGKAWEEEYERANRVRAQGAEQYQARLQAERDRDDAASIRDILAAQAREIRSMILVGPDESVPEAVRRVLMQRDELRVKLASLPTASGGMGWYAESVVNEVRAQRDDAIAKLEAVRRAAK